jgi:oxygen-independent coproporphyrinogen III oxidase
LAGIYIHIPFCRQACTYCNFHFSVSLKNKALMIEALAKEILSTSNFITDTNIETIYIGGGTPSLLTPQDLQIIFESINKKFSVAIDAEITLEANPDDINETILKQWKAFGINRLSLGLQSFNAAELAWMNRAHSAEQSHKSIHLIKEAGFNNFSVDLIYGSPLQTNDDLKRNFDIIAKANIPHISCYALTVENSTLLNKLIKENNAEDIDTEKQAEQFHLLLDYMGKHSYEQYEISNFSKKGYRSKHNSSYWQGKAYFGFGPSAHSYNGKNKRRWNVANNSLYIQSFENNITAHEEETLTIEQQLNEYVMTALRTIEGISLEKIEKQFGKENVSRILLTAEKYIIAGKMISEPPSLLLTAQGKFFADGIAADLFC